MTNQAEHPTDYRCDRCMGDGRPAPASDDECEEFFELLQSYGADIERADTGRPIQMRCSVCFGPWVSCADDDELLHDPDCSSVVGPRIQARLASERARADKAGAEVDRLRGALNEMLTRGTGHGHWDSSMRGGVGCPLCIEQREVAVIARAALAPASDPTGSPEE